MKNENPPSSVFLPPKAPRDKSSRSLWAYDSLGTTKVFAMNLLKHFLWWQGDLFL